MIEVTDRIDRAAATRRPQGQRVVMRQEWRDLLFLHWPVAPEVIAPLLPPGLTVDTFGGMAYIGLVPFVMRNVRPVWAPAVPGLSHFAECNVRTYVHRGGADPGLWFLSLDAANAVAVTIARTLWRLPYFVARMTVRTGADGVTEYRTTRQYPALPAAETCVRFAPTGTPAPATPGTLEYFLAERYLLYAHAHGRLLRGQVHHGAYPLQGARVDFLSDTSVAAGGVPLTAEQIADPPLAHFARGVQVEVFPLRGVRVDRQ